MVVNDVCESHLATTTANLNSTKNIAAAAADGDAQRQNFLTGNYPEPYQEPRRGHSFSGARQSGLQ